MNQLTIAVKDLEEIRFAIDQLEKYGIEPIISTDRFGYFILYRK